MMLGVIATHFLTVIIFILLLSVLVLIHEFGHFFVAKRLGIKVEEFGFGFPPRAFGKKIGETIYSINYLPFGGFVKLYGEDEAGAGRITLPGKTKSADTNLNKAFFSRPTWQKALVVVAGVIMNYLLAVVIFSYLAQAQGIATEGNSIIVAQVEKNSPAQDAGIKIGDKIIKVNDQNMANISQLISFTKSHEGQEISVTIQRNNTLQVINLTPRTKVGKNQGAMGVALSPDVKIIKYSGLSAIKKGISQTFELVSLTLTGLKVAIAQALHLQFPQGVAGPFGIVRLTGVAQQYGPFAVLTLAGALSLTLAIFNIFPIPALDGGRLFFILLDGVLYLVFRKKLSSKIEGYINPIAFAILIGLILLISYHDIVSWASGQPLLPQ